MTYVPAADAETVKQALFDAGAGRIGRYEHCCWQTTGSGQFRPLPGSDPTIGRHGELETVEELRIEMVVPESLAASVITALRRAHPYETPAFHLLSVHPLTGSA